MPARTRRRRSPHPGTRPMANAMNPPAEGAAPLLTMTTDFGTAGGYVGAMKGCVLSLAPAARIVDISHDIAPHAVPEGAWCLRRAVPHFPPGTVHLAVVDPGVGGGRAALVVETERFLLVGPDNGVLSLAAQAGGLRRVFAIREQPPERVRSPSFDGLTLFAPTAARLLLGAGPEELGEPVAGMEELAWREPQCGAEVIVGEVLFFDRFGNAVTNITRDHLGPREPARVVLGAGVEARPCTHYAALAGRPGQPGALWNSDGHLELALYGDSLQARRGLQPGDPVRVEPGA